MLTSLRSDYPYKTIEWFRRGTFYTDQHFQYFLIQAQCPQIFVAEVAGHQERPGLRHNKFPLDMETYNRKLNHADFTGNGSKTTCF